jgi:hypothetical protein
VHDIRVSLGREQWIGLCHPAGRTQSSRRTNHEVRRLSLVIGGAVRIANGVSVGKIEDVVLNDRGCIDYVVVVYHDNYVAIPWSVVTVDYGERIVTVDITEQRFAEVPTFTRTEFSVLTTSEFTQKVHSAFGGKGESTSPNAGAKAESPKAGAKAESPKAGAKAESPKGARKPTKSESKREPPKAAAQKNPNGESKVPKGESNDKPNRESKEKRKGESKDKPKR